MSNVAGVAGRSWHPILLLRIVHLVINLLTDCCGREELTSTSRTMMETRRFTRPHFREDGAMTRRWDASWIALTAIERPISRRSIVLEYRGESVTLHQFDFWFLTLLLQIAEMLVEAGADKKAVNNDGKTALDIVAEVNDPEDLDDMYLVAALRD
jgi:hypothetical protein